MVCKIQSFHVGNMIGSMESYIEFLLFVSMVYEIPSLTLGEIIFCRFPIFHFFGRR